jgi:hypothetical protein
MAVNVEPVFRLEGVRLRSFGQHLLNTALDVGSGQIVNSKEEFENRFVGLFRF